MTPELLTDRLAEIAAWMQEGQFEVARSALQVLTQVYPDSAAAWKAQGVSENKLGCPKTAENCLRESLRLDESDSDAWSSLGGVYVALGRYTDALEAFERGLAHDPTDTYALLNILSMAALVADLDAARRHHARALHEGQRRCEAQTATRTNLPWCWYDLAQIHFLGSKDAEFRGTLGQAISASSKWQVVSARKIYELLAGSATLNAEAAAALTEFARLEREYTGTQVHSR